MTAQLTILDANDFHRGTVRAKSVGHEQFRPAITLHRALDKLQRGFAIQAFRGKNFEDLAFVINRTPEVVRFTVDPDEQLIQVPSPQ